MGASTVKEIDMYFKKQSHLEAWSLKLAECAIVNVVLTPLRVIEVKAQEEAEEEESAASDNKATSPFALLAIWSELTGRFAPRYFFLSDGILSWHRPGTSKAKARKVRLASASDCFVLSVEAVEDIHEPSTYKFQIRLTIRNWDIKLIIGLPDLATTMALLRKLHEALEIAPRDKRPSIPTECTRDVDLSKRSSVATGSETGRPEDTSRNSISLNASTAAASVNNSTEEEEDASRAGIIFEGYLFKKGDQGSVAETLGVSAFRWRWFVLRDAELLYYKTKLQFQSGEKYSGCIDLRYVYLVREAEDPKLPENTIEIFTPQRVYVLAAEDEDNQACWIEALGDAVEARKEALAESAVTEEERRAARQADISKAVQHKGSMLVKTTARLTGIVSWKEYFFALTPGEK